MNNNNDDDNNINNIQNLIFVPQGCSYFLDTTNNDQQHIVGLITQSCGPCVCIIVRNRDNTKMVLAHVDSGNDITDEEFGLPKWVRQCGDGNNVTVEVHMGCGYNPNVDRDRITTDINSIGNELGLNENQIMINQDRNSFGGMILRNGYNLVIDKTKSIRRKLNPNYRRNVDQISERWINEEITVNCYKILQNPERKEDRIILNEQISFDENMTDKVFKKIQQQIPEHIDNILKHTNHNIATHIKDTLNLQNKTKIDSKFCHEHNIKVPLISLNEINRFENGLTEEFKNRINDQPYIKDIEHYKEEETYIDRQEYWRDYISKRQKMSKKTLERM